MNRLFTRHKARGAVRLSLLLFLFFPVLLVRAQLVNSYQFSTNTTSSLALDLSLNPIDMSTGTTQLVAADLDNAASPVTSIGFPFTFGGGIYTQFSASSNGIIRLGGTAIAAATYSTNAATGTAPHIAPMGGDLRTGAAGKVHYKLVGTSPNQALVIEFLNMSLDYVGTPGSNDGTFQVRLYETSNVVEFVYGSMFRNTSATNSGTQTFNISLATGTTSPNRICVDTNNALITTGTLTVNNYILGANMAKVHSTTNGSRRAYIFTPPAPALPPAPVTGTKGTVTASSAVLNGTITTGAYPALTASGIVVGLSPNPVVGGFGVIDSTTNPVLGSGAFSKTFTGLMNGTTYYYRTYATNTVGTSYGPDSTFTTDLTASLPSLTKTAATSVTASAATVGGNITSDGGASVFASGIVYGTSPNPALFDPMVVDSPTTPLVANGAFTIRPQGLTPSTKYYYRAYATNSVGTGYSVQDSFTTLTLSIPVLTKQPTLIPSATSASLTGAITSNGNGTITASGFVYGTSPNPSLGGPGVVDSATNPLVITGTFTKNIAGLTPATKYYYRAYATNQAGTGYSTQDSFTTVGLVTLVLPYTESFDGTAPGWFTAAEGTSPNNWVMGVPAKANFNAAFSAPNAWVTKLTGNYDAYHHGSVISPSFDASALTQDPILVFRHRFITEAAYDAGMVEISINGGQWVKVENVLGTGSNFNTATAFAWYNNNSANGPVPPKFSGNSNTYSSQSGGWIQSQATLAGAAGKSDVRFRFRFSADVSNQEEGWMFDDVALYAASAPVMLTSSVSNITTSNATTGGTIVFNGGSSITASGIVYATSPSPTVGGFGVVDSPNLPVVTSGSFTKNISGLQGGVSYYVRSYATNATGTGYGPDSMFTTPAAPVAPTVTKVPAVNIATTTATVGGAIVSDGGSAVTASGIVYGTSPNPALFDPGVVDSTTNPLVASGSFTISPAGLSPGTKYYYRAYASNPFGTGYSVQDSFTTQPLISSFPYLENFDVQGSNHGWSSRAISGTNQWELGTPAKTFLSGAKSGTRAWATKLTGIYDANALCVLESPQFDFSSLTADPVLRFANKFVTEQTWDAMDVEMSINGGAWTKVDNATGTGGNYSTLNSEAWYTSASTNGPISANKFTSVTSNVGSNVLYASQVNGWVTSKTVLTGAAGQANVRFRFRFGSDGSTQYDGFAIDDIEVFVPAVPTVITGTKTNVTAANAILGGNITNNGGSPVTGSGIVIGLTPNPVRGGTGVIDSATSPVVTSGAFTRFVEGLFPGTTYYYRAYAVNAVGTSYGDDSVVTTASSAVAPTVTKVSATNIFAYSATAGGNITSDGGAAVIASGIVYSTSPNPAIGDPGVVDSATNPVVAMGSFSISPAGLSSLTKYYYRAYATNSAGTAYSAQDSFTTGYAIASYPYLQDFDTAVNHGWVARALSGTNQWELGTPAKAYLNGAKSGTKAWATKLTGTYDANALSVLESPQFDFSTLTTDPFLRFANKFVTEQTWDAMDVEISINGGAWTKLDNTLGTGANYNTTNSQAWYTSASTNGPISANKFTSLTTNVGSNALYATQVNGWVGSQTLLAGVAGQTNVRFRLRFGSDGSGQYDGFAIDDIELFTPSAPMVMTGTNTNLTTSNATLGGIIVNNGGYAVTASGVVIGTSPNPVRGGMGVIDSASSPLAFTGSFTINTTALSPATVYYYRAYAENSLGLSYGADSMFTTPASAIAPTVTKAAPANVTTSTVTVGGAITSDGGSPVTASGIVYGTSPNPALFDPGVVDSTTNPVITSGSFTISPAGLSPNTKYYYRAYATNVAGTGYSVQDSFTTQPVISLLPYTENFDVPGANHGWIANVLAGLNQWELGTPAKTYLNGPHSGTRAWATKLTGNYEVSSTGALVSPQFDFSALTRDPVLRFYQKFTTEQNWDAMVVEVSTNGGGTWTKLGNAIGTAANNYNTATSHAWYPNNSGSGPVTPPKFASLVTGTGSNGIYNSQDSGWIQSATLITGVAGQANVKIRFLFAADGSNEYEGFAIDDIEVVSIDSPTVQASNIVLTPSATSALVSLTKGNGQRRLIVARLTTTAPVAPVNWTYYKADSVFGAGDSTGTGNYVVYGDTGAVVTVTGLTQLTGYTFDVYEFDGKYMHTRFGISSSSNTVTTPVKLVAFSGINRDGNGLLTWSTSSEINNAGFEVERSVDGRTFVAAGFVKGSGNSNTVKHYGFTDAGVFAATGASKVYYRLKQVDYDSRSEYSNVISISKEQVSKFEVSAYPVPFSKDVTLNIASAKDGNATIMIFDVQGRLVAEKAVDLHEGNNALSLSELNDVEGGIYFVRTTMDGYSAVTKVVKN